MTFQSPPPLEDIGEVAWQRLENQLFDRLDRSEAAVVDREDSSKRIGWRVAALGALAVACVLVVALWPTATEPTTTAAGTLSRLVTASAPSSMTVGDAALTAGPNTALLVVDNGAGGAHVVLERGAVDCAVAKRPGRPPFRVIAGDAVVEVTGTNFRVERVGDSARVSVTEGSVRVLSNGVLSVVAAGATWPAETAQKPIPPRPIGTSKPAPVPEPEPESKSAPEDPVDAGAVSRRAKAAKQPTAKERYRTAAGLESSDPAAALAIYRSLARQRGPWSATALFAQGRLEFERNQRASALRTLSRYLRRYPKGNNASDARHLLKQLQKSEGKR